MESSKRCTLDYLMVYDGDSVTSSVLFGPLCGDMSAPGSDDDDDDDDDDVAAMFQRSYVTSSAEVLVEFHTDEDVSQSGFMLSYTKAGT